jgi:hypothetical protein
MIGRDFFSSSASRPGPSLTDIWSVIDEKVFSLTFASSASVFRRGIRLRVLSGAF